MLNKGISGQTWRECDRCGFMHPVGLLRRQKGLMVCSCHGCADNLQIERRPMQIAAVLSDPNEFVSETEVALASDQGELVF